jgi:predicted RND superfamily exporter protein
MRKVEKKYLALSWVIVILVLAITVGFMLSLKENVRMETNLDEYMPRTHPAFVYSDQAEEWFNIKDGILVALRIRTGSIIPGLLKRLGTSVKGLCLWMRSMRRM